MEKWPTTDNKQRFSVRQFSVRQSLQNLRRRTGMFNSTSAFSSRSSLSSSSLSSSSFSNSNPKTPSKKKEIPSFKPTNTTISSTFSPNKNNGKINNSGDLKNNIKNNSGDIKNSSNVKNNCYRKNNNKNSFISHHKHSESFQSFNTTSTSSSIYSTISTNASIISSKSSKTNALRYESRNLPSLEDLKLFYHGYPKQKLIIEAATVLLRIEHGEWVSDVERYLIRATLAAEIRRYCEPGSLEFLTWQVLVDLWNRIPV
ncbi:134_t:CDS:1 [Ambispora leptoticha]|uniref:134_t:CDS:1 n=1 Tax=Ambispora leptoticha TaxID=144679 RepID=A0A9N8VZE0_9GLOM|nr:134_t:CDS:1 [Ambispora leptoticha]